MKLTMTLAFDEVKATQAAALFLKLAGVPLNYMALIKLLYRADREAFRRCGLSITTDKYVSMKLGPVTSNIYDRIKASLNPNAHPTFWWAHIQRTADAYTVALQVDPGNSELSRAEEKLIEEVFAADGQKDPFALADECHRDFPEWDDPGESSSPIDISDIIAALGLSEDEAAQIESLIDKQRAAFSLVAYRVVVNVELITRRRRRNRTGHGVPYRGFGRDTPQLSCTSHKDSGSPAVVHRKESHANTSSKKSRCDLSGDAGRALKSHVGLFGRRRPQCLRFHTLGAARHAPGRFNLRGRRAEVYRYRPQAEETARPGQGFVGTQHRIGLP
jgi:uncharacterized phage-associated protein